MTNPGYLLSCALSFQDGVGVSDELLALYCFLQLWQFRAELLTKVLPSSGLEERNIRNLQDLSLIFSPVIRIAKISGTQPWLPPTSGSL